MKCDCIAVLENTDNSITNMENCTRLSVWLRDWSVGKGWHAAESVPFSLEGCDTLAKMRDKLRQLASLLPADSAIAGASISGVAYNELSRMGFCLCELDAFTPDILDALASEILASAQGEAEVPTAPTPTDAPGVYSINLMEVQAAHPDITSKKALRPFLASTPFVELKIICGHMPPWLEEHLRQHRLTCSIARQEDGTVHASISHALCGETPSSGLQEHRS
ncbi:hypothetical protein DDIC_05685 [Desulfovibrio desulfuricans]|uniref:Fe-only nitrogenase accessory protein AnfO n=1 Tax=Desulfovibrio desulfuricans TaxID=876 RepID=A0A4P7UGR6_DESDE|nr:Fe-only nitrogenase accessory AnfO family protein [Desulfovibrio desulfuricans]QCC85373.1 hypothetical protein DDIC_05685 [Desulfovibrio desulfuricans]